MSRDRGPADIYEWLVLDSLMGIGRGDVLLKGAVNAACRFWHAALETRGGL